MEQGFIDILRKLVKEQGNIALTDAGKCKAFLADYTGSEYKKERRFILQAVEAGAAKVIAGADDLASCKRAQIGELEEEFGLTQAVAADIVDALALVLRGEEKPKNRCKNCGKELPEEWKACPYCGTQVAGQETTPAAAPAAAKVVTVKPSPEGDYAFMEGKKYWDNREYDKAVEPLTKAINLGCTEMCQAYILRGHSYRDTGQYDQAIRDYTTVINLDPNNVVAYGSRGYTLHKKGQYDQAISDHTKAISLKPNEAACYAYRGETYCWKGQYEQAISDCTTAISLDPRDGMAYGSRGLAYSMIGQYDQAINDCTKAISLNTNKADAYLGRAMAYFAKGQYGDPVGSDLKKGQSLEPNHPVVEKALQKLRGY